MFELIDRRSVKREARAIVRDAQVPAKAFFAVYLALTVVINFCGFLTDPAETESLLSSPVSLFISIFSTLLLWALGAGAFLYCMAIRRGERAEYFVLFDGFSFAGKLILLRILQSVLIFTWSLLFVFPGIIAAYRYRFAPLNLYENPSLTPLEALRLSKRQSRGYKYQLFQLDLSYFGWEMLASLPTVYVTMAQSLAEAGTVLPGPHGSALVMFVLDAAFLLAVGTLYRPAYQVAELAYFETAVRTSGQDPHRTHPASDGEDASFF